MIPALLNAVNGYKTYIAAAGLFGLAAYDASTGNYSAAYAAFVQALGLAGIRHAVAKAGGV